MTITLSAVKREETGKASKALLSAGSMPAVVYGPKQEAVSITVASRDFEKILRDSGESTVIDLQGLGTPLQVLIHEIDRDPVTNVPRHADFYAIEKGAKVEVAVPLSYVGESAAVKAGGSLVKVLHELEIESSPANLPQEIEVDISVLAAIGDQIHVSDLKLPSGVEAKIEGDQIVALIQEVEVEAEETVAAPDMAAIEVEKKGKTEEEGGEAAA
ncbi:MAG TPA: 50S ribosomal protein L25 [Candidatus Paceibacterota bacterium]|nr:50S ribosomal protein L25 [Candidatus Paceibacterota bacterium]